MITRRIEYPFFDKEITQAVQIVSEKAAELWIAFSGEKCQLLVAMNDLGTTTESSKAQAGENRSLNLVIRPELRRVGDSEGERFDSETTVSGCTGETMIILYR
jgi:hypothetical protein